MIPIRRKNLQQLAERHYKSIIEYAKNIQKNSRGRKPEFILNMSTIENLEKWLLNKMRINYRDLILAKPVQLDEIAEKFLALKKEETIQTKKKKTIIKKYWDAKEITKDFYKIYELYDDFSSNTSSKWVIDNERIYNGKALTFSLGLTVCPYCNRNFINQVLRKDSNEGKDTSIENIEMRTSQLDHFYPRSDFPILAMSFYNLIPCCPTCNFIKKDFIDVSKKFYNPYDSRYDGNKAFQFKLKILSPEFYYKKEAIRILYDGLDGLAEHQLRIKENLKVFRIEGLYQNHKDYVIDLIQKNIVYSDSYIDELYKNYEGTLFKNREDVLRLVTSNYVTEDELEKRPLAKLTRDIAEELGLI